MGEKKEEKENRVEGACVQISGLSKTVTKKSLVHEILKGYKITNYGLYMETEKGICTGKCYVEFISKEVRDAAIKAVNELKIKTTEIENNSFDSPARLPDTTAEDMEDSS